METQKLDPPKRLAATVTATIVAPEDCSEHQFTTWIMQEIGATATDLTHPLIVHDFRGNIKDLKIKIVKPKA